MDDFIRLNHQEYRNKIHKIFFNEYNDKVILPNSISNYSDYLFIDFNKYINIIESNLDLFFNQYDDKINNILYEYYIDYISKYYDYITPNINFNDYKFYIIKYFKLKLIEYVNTGNVNSFRNFKIEFEKLLKDKENIWPIKTCINKIIDSNLSFKCGYIIDASINSNFEHIFYRYMNLFEGNFRDISNKYIIYILHKENIVFNNILLELKKENKNLKKNIKFNFIILCFGIIAISNLYLKN